MSTPNPAKKFFGHPIQLSTLFHIELWERFSFYGMQAILLFYLYFEASKGGLGIDEAEAGGISADIHALAKNLPLRCISEQRSRDWAVNKSDKLVRREFVDLVFERV